MPPSKEQIIACLSATPLFASLSRANKERLAERVIYTVHAARETIARQGELGTEAFLVYSGELISRAEDERGGLTPPQFWGPGSLLGETSLLVGEPRDATVRVNKDAELLRIRKADLDQLCQQHLDLWRELRIRPDVRLKLEAPHFSWLAPGERVEWFGRKHWIVFVRSMAGLLPFFLAGLVLAFLLGGRASPWLLATIVVLFLAAGMPLVIWRYKDWRNDFHVVTDRRIVHEENILLRAETRDEALLEKWQNTLLRRGLLGGLLGYAHLDIATAGARGTVRFMWVSQPEVVSQVIIEQVRRLRMRQRARRREEIERLLDERLQGVEDGGWWDLPPPSPPPKQRSIPPLLETGVPTRPGCLRVITGSALYSFLMCPHLPRFGRIVEGQNIIWRKHWAVLLASIALPGVLFLLSLAVTAYVAWRPGDGLLKTALLLFGLLFSLAMAALLVWRYEDWRNDLYVVTPTQIIDVERTPFLFSESRRQAALENIQNISLKIPTFGGLLLNMGDVVIETAGQGQFTFMRVQNPSRVQAEIFERMEALRARRQEAERKQREAELGDWFSIYHRKLGSPPANKP